MLVDPFSDGMLNSNECRRNTKTRRRFHPKNWHDGVEMFRTEKYYKCSTNASQMLASSEL